MVVLPEPLGPTRATNSPAATCSETSSTAWIDAEIGVVGFDHRAGFESVAFVGWLVHEDNPRAFSGSMRTA